MHFPRGPRERPLARRQRRTEAVPSGQEEVEGPGLTPTAGSGAVPAPNEPFFVTLPPLRLLAAGVAAGRGPVIAHFGGHLGKAAPRRAVAPLPLDARSPDF